MSPEFSGPGANGSISGLTRRNLMQRSALLFGGAALASLLEACSAAPAAPAAAPTVAPAAAKAAAPTAAPAAATVAPAAAPTVAPAAAKSAATKLVLLDAGNMDTPEAAPRKQILSDFTAKTPNITFDVRALATGKDWDRLARTSVSAGEQVDLLNINGQFVRAWVRDNLLDDLATHPELSAAFAKVDPSFLAAQADDPKHPYALPVFHASPVQVTALFYNKTILDKAGVQPPKTFADMRAMVEPLKKIGAVPLVHPAGEIWWNPLLVMWIQPMLVNNQPMEFTMKTMKGEIKYNGPEWVKTFDTIAGLSRDGILLPGSGALGLDAAYQLFYQGKAAMLYNGSWILPALTKGLPAGGGIDLHVAGLPLVENAQKAQPLIAFSTYAIPAASKNKDAAVKWLTYASDASVDSQLVDKIQAFSPNSSSNSGIKDPIYKEVAPWFKDGIAPLDWLWEPEVTTEIQNQVQALVKGEAQPQAAGDAVQAKAEELRREGRSYFK
jgi:raffinose/stachyose/melibiose transport system substrate-binding protein